MILFLGSRIFSPIQDRQLEDARSIIANLSELGNEIVVFTSSDKKKTGSKPVIPCIKIELDGKEEIIEEICIYEEKVEKSTVYTIVGNNLDYANQDISDEIFAKATLEAITLLKVTPKIIHAYGWDMAQTLNLIQSTDLALIGNPKIIYDLADLKSSTLSDTQSNTVSNALKTADTCIIGSESLLKEKCADWFITNLQARKGPVHTITTALDYVSFDPSSDKALTYKYSSETEKERPKNLQDVIKKEKLSYDKNNSVVALIGDWQHMEKEQAVGVLDGLLQTGHLVLVGLSNLDEIDSIALTSLKTAFPDTMAFNGNATSEDQRQFLSASDVAIFPDNTALTASSVLLAMRYGAIPVVYKAGAGAEVTEPYNANRETGYGFIYDKPSAWSIFAAVIRAEEVKRFPFDWQGIVRESQDVRFFWKEVAKSYINIYREVLGKTSKDDTEKE